MKIDFEGCYEEWAEVLVEALLPHFNIPDHEEHETELSVEEMDERGIYLGYEYYDEEDGYDEARVWIRYWIDQTWPTFCVSYCLYNEEDEDIERGACKIVMRRGKGKCIPLVD